MIRCVLHLPSVGYIMPPDAAPSGVTDLFFGESSSQGEGGGVDSGRTGRREQFLNNLPRRLKIKPSNTNMRSSETIHHAVITDRGIFTNLLSNSE